VIVGAIVIAFFSPLNRSLLLPATGEPQRPPWGRWVVPLLYTSINHMGDLGLSSFVASGVVFFLVETAVALVLVVASPLFRQNGFVMSHSDRRPG